MLGLLLIAGFLIVSLGPLWFRYFVQDSVIRRTEARVLEGAEIVYGTTIVIATLALIPLLVLQIRRPTPVRVRFWTTRCLVLAISVVLSAGVAEGVAVACLWATSIPMPWLPVRFEDGPDDAVTDILVVGESSAQGVPYEKWLSVADIVAWKLGTAFPRMEFRIVNQATPGLSLQAMHTKLAGIERRPELVILYAGHNEFSSRFDWAHGALSLYRRNAAGHRDAPEPGPAHFSTDPADGGNLAAVASLYPADPNCHTPIGRRAGLHRGTIRRTTHRVWNAPGGDRYLSRMDWGTGRAGHSSRQRCRIRAQSLVSGTRDIAGRARRVCRGVYRGSRPSDDKSRGGRIAYRRLLEHSRDLPRLISSSPA